MYKNLDFYLCCTCCTQLFKVLNITNRKQMTCVTFIRFLFLKEFGFYSIDLEFISWFSIFIFSNDVNLNEDLKSLKNQFTLSIDFIVWT